MVAFALCDVLLVGLLIYEYTKGKNYYTYLVSLFICSIFHYAFPWVPGSAIWQGFAKGVVDWLF
ncbi:hypothetical protein [Dyadobacter fanqingshengii]|uniref:Uncharacterized protein n=2 Tax=Dyadobacter fanqingshengii TaxID=2906443 RepID=A0A9X1PBB5_9BACT|nr:hypothetical protein [Dyadobacter fanqingshengii]MCF0042024.1 hypothetical protein [Dyadobacter fanqingshengii]USJ36273.1 hypothetical protein NFI81_00560 [Dyadobacter fanqingshengii]